MWYFYLYCLSLSVLLSLCLSLSLSGPLACAIWGLIEDCKAQVGFGCRLFPTGIRWWRASAKTTAYIDPERLCTHRCLNQREASTHTETRVFFNMNELCVNKIQKLSLAATDQNWYKSLFTVWSFLQVTMWNYSIFDNCVCQVLSILAMWPWVFVEKLKIYYHLFPWIYLLWSIKFSWS